MRPICFRNAHIGICDFLTSWLLLRGPGKEGQAEIIGWGYGQQAGQYLCCLRMRTRPQSNINSQQDSYQKSLRHLSLTRHLWTHSGEFRASGRSGVLINGDGKNSLDGLQKYMMDEESTPLRFSQFPGVPPFLNYIVGPGDVPVHPPPILRSVIEQLLPILCSVKQANFAE